MHTPPNATVFVTLREEDERITLDVIDDGPGLGLAIVAAIVGAHKITVTAANEPDHGAHFTVTLQGNV
jgi:signal transduction histidine kinase